MRRRSILVVSLLAMVVAYVVGSAVSAQELGYTGPKKRIAVVDFECKAPRSSWKVGSGMAEMLITALHQTGRFIVLERKAIQDVIEEQDLGASGRLRPETAAKIGDILGAQVLIRGAITEYSQRESGGGLGGISKEGFGFGIAGTTGHVTLDIRMYDATTGVVLESHRADKEITERGLALGGRVGDITIGTAGFKKTPIGKATRAAIEDAVQFIVGKMEAMPWQGRVVLAKEGKIYLNAGSNSNVKVGTAFDIYRPGEELIDPETGLSLGSEEEKIGSIQVVKVEEKFSIGKAISGSGFAREDIVRLPSE